MSFKLSVVIFQTTLFLIVNINNVSKAQYYPKAGYDGKSNVLQMPHNFKDKVTLKVYYETQCPASIKFVKEQLAPTVARLADHLDVYMIPYGHAKTRFENGRYLFDCQHGDIECYGNMLHASAIDVIRNNTKAALFCACAMERTRDYNTINNLVNSCGYKYHVPVNSIWESMNNGRGTWLLKRYGDETHALRPQYVPYVTLDGVLADGVTSNHVGYFVCRLLNPRPTACDSGS